MPNIKQIFASIANQYDLANSVLSVGRHKFWRKDAFRRISIPVNSLILDLCCGTGAWTSEINKQSHESNTVVGLDFSVPMLRVAKAARGNLGKRKHKPIYLCGNAEQLPFADESFDIITIGFGIRNVENVRICLAECHRVLKPHGNLLILEFGQSSNRYWSIIFNGYSRWILPTIGGLLTGNRAAYLHLYQSSRHFPCGNEFGEILKICGFKVEKLWSYLGGSVYAYSARKLS